MRRRHGQKFVEQLRGCAILCRTNVSPTLCSAAIDAPPASAIVGLGILIVLAPSSVPGLTPPMCDVIGAAGDAKLWFRQEGEKQ
jgi:hypothetical protein